MNELILSEIDEQVLNHIVGMSMPEKVAYFANVIAAFYPTAEKNSEEWENLIQSYISSLYMEKVYRSNRFLQESFTPIYTGTGLIRNMVLDIFFNDDDLTTH
jgi:hypothetical protein